MQLSYRNLKSGNADEAINECDRTWNSAVEAEDLPRKRYSLHLKGLAYLAAEKTDDAQKTADKLKKLI